VVKGKEEIEKREENGFSSVGGLRSEVDHLKIEDLKMKI